MQIQDAYKPIKISLPSYEGSELEVSTKVKVEDVLEAKDKDELEMAILFATKLLKKWNFQDSEGKDLPIEEKYIKQLPAEDLNFLMEQIMPYVEKKTTSEKTK